MSAHVLVPRETRSVAAPGRPGHPHRHGGDLVRVGLGLALLGVGFLLARRGEISLLERDLFRLVNDLPTLVLPVVWAVMQLGNVVAVPTVAALAAATRRLRLARDLLVSGVLAYLGADLVKSAVQRERPAGLPVGDVLVEGPITGLGFISGHTAVAAALATAAAPYLSRRPRRVVWALAWTVGLARIYVGAHLPLDVLGGIGAGWAIGSLVHWVFGVPRWQPDPGRVAGLLHRFGLPVTHLAPAGGDARSSHPFTGVDEDSRPVFVKVLDPDRYERDWLYRAARWLAVRDVKDADALAPLDQQAANEALAAMTARERGVRAPAVLLARGAGRLALVVQRRVDGRGLDELSAAEFTPALLDEVWHQVALLRHARVAHHDLVAASLLVDAAGSAWVVDFGNAQTGAEDEALSGDVAELLASLAAVAPAERVVSSAVRVLGAEAVAAALPGLAPLSLSAANRGVLRADPERLPRLRAEVRRQLGLPHPDRPGAVRTGPWARAAAVASAGVVFSGLTVVAGGAGILESVERGGWRWLGGALLFAVLGRAALAAATLAAVERRIALGRAFGATTSTDCAGVLRGRPGGRRVAARFLERAGVLPAAAERATVRTAAASTAAAGLVAVVAVVLGLVEGRLGGWRTPASPLPLLLVGAAGLLLVLAVRALTRRGADGQAGPAQHQPSWSAARPRSGDAVRWGALLGWSTLGIALEAAALAAALHAVGGHLPLLATTAVYALIRLAWTVVPVLALPGAGEVLLLLALTALGAPLAGACAGVLVFRLLVFWVPVAVGALVIGRSWHHEPV
ncbi:phosphatase PAP2 family protein [Modestobacter roseus]|uniref:phosphatase PAP2 family protein n=1 Tax=Modestobacter roseus TaxID=1181884 RepID=UPI0034E04763